MRSGPSIVARACFAGIVVVTTTLIRTSNVPTSVRAPDRFASEEVAERHGDHRVYIGIGADFGWGFVVEQPDVCREGHDGTCHCKIR